LRWGEGIGGERTDWEESQAEERLTGKTKNPRVWRVNVVIRALGLEVIRAWV